MRSQLRPPTTVALLVLAVASLALFGDDCLAAKSESVAGPQPQPHHHEHHHHHHHHRLQVRKTQPSGDVGDNAVSLLSLSSGQYMDPGSVAAHYGHIYSHWAAAAPWMGRDNIPTLENPGSMPFGFPRGLRTAGVSPYDALGSLMYQDPHAALGTSLFGYAPFGIDGHSPEQSADSLATSLGTQPDPMEGGSFNPVSRSPSVFPGDGLGTIGGQDSLWPAAATFPAGSFSNAFHDTSQYPTYNFPSLNPEFPTAPGGPYRVPTPVWDSVDLSIV
eukprot:gnl/Hemi2/14246_TR4834_c0_g1_i1.p1 gnl/Hemi2/14246_TR4834_c0_g1~~gnl/Hemi2/14246_TR4834_c0_g1_i1.p1  ORF type:complete len:274 (+),score=25.26 gnl/Hemi2/14246_TR4834_c0_g1_i1:46-867(+)